MVKKSMVGEVDREQERHNNDIQSGEGETVVFDAKGRFRMSPSPEVVYFVSTDDAWDYPIKIGISTERGLGLRLAALQNGCPFELHVMKTLPGGATLEKKLHRRFKDDRLCGEWFERSDRLMRLVNGPRKEPPSKIDPWNLPCDRPGPERKAFNAWCESIPVEERYLDCVMDWVAKSPFRSLSPSPKEERT